jgi:SAM-dependent methyltransferase
MAESSAAGRYFLPPDYRENPVASRTDVDSGRLYWTLPRRASSRYFQASVYRLAGELVDRHGYRSVLDVGCGPGIKLARLSRRRSEVAFTGIDQQEAVDYCRRTHRFGSWYADDLDSPDPAIVGGTADLVICADVIEHLGEPDVLLENLARRLEPGGRLVLSTPDREARWGAEARHSPVPDHVREWSFSELALYLQDRGFTIDEHFHDWPIRVGPNPWFLKDLAHQLRHGLTPRYNQVCVLRRG